jgi:virginiamycin B lyase
MTARLLCASIVALALAAPAHAGEVGRIPLDGIMYDLVADPAGGAWALHTKDFQRTEVTRLDAGRPTRLSTAVRGVPGGAAVGPDGSLWFDARERLHRIDREARRSVVTRFLGAESIEAALAAGPDGAMWTVTNVNQRLARISPNGVVAVSPFPTPVCDGTHITDIARASDGAMWIADADCRRLVRVPVEGAASVVALGELEPAQLEADPAGGMWFVADGVVGHSGGARHTVGNVKEIGVTSDGTVLAADGTCTLKRIGGAPVPAPVPAARIDVAGDNLYLASATRVFQNLDGGPCEQIPPKVTLRPRRLSPAAFKRGKLQVTVKEPVHLAFFVEDHEFIHERTMRGAGTWRVKPSKAALRRIGNRRSFYFVLTATDADGYDGGTDGYIRLTMP